LGFTLLIEKIVIDIWNQAAVLSSWVDLGHIHYHRIGVHFY